MQISLTCRSVGPLVGDPHSLGENSQGAFALGVHLAGKSPGAGNVWEMYGNLWEIYFGGFLEKMSVIFSYHPLSSSIFHSFSIEKNPGSPATWKFWETMRKTHASLARAKESAVARSALAAATAKMRQFLFGPRQKWGFHQEKRLLFFFCFPDDILMGDLSRDA